MTESPVSKTLCYPGDEIPDWNTRSGKIIRVSRRVEALGKCRVSGENLIAQPSKYMVEGHGEQKATSRTRTCLSMWKEPTTAPACSMEVSVSKKTCTRRSQKKAKIAALRRTLKIHLRSTLGESTRKVTEEDRILTRGTRRVDHR